MHLRLHLIVPTVLAGALFAAGCDQAPPASAEQVPGEEARPSSTESFINGTLLHSIQVAADHRIDFYDFGDGNNAVHESMTVEDGAPLTEAIDNPESLARVFRAIKGDAEAVPQALLDADVRAATFAQTELVQVPQTAAEPPQLAAGPSAALQAAGAGSCSADLEGNGWWGTGFLNSYCVEGNYRWCDDNWGSAQSNQFETSWLRWRQFEGDWNVSGYTSGAHLATSGCCFLCASCKHYWKNDWSYSVLPRHLETWTYTSRGTRSIYGSSPCGHLHFAFLYNM